MPMTGHRFLKANRRAEATRFGEDVEITVNYDVTDLELQSAVLPQYGFLIESPSLVAFHASSYRALKFTRPTMLVVQSADGKHLSSSQELRMYAAFGDTPSRWDGKDVTLKR